MTESTRHIHATRESWLLAASAELSTYVAQRTGLVVPPHCVSVGFPRGPRGRRKANGQCFPTDLAADGKFHIFVSPELDAESGVLHVLLHELLHAAVGTKEGHKGAFVKAAGACGLQKPWSATTPNAELTSRLNELFSVCGYYPHGLLAAPNRRNGSRLRLWVCPCPVRVRVASDEFDATCNRCGSLFQSSR